MDNKTKCLKEKIMEIVRQIILKIYNSQLNSKLLKNQNKKVKILYCKSQQEPLPIKSNFLPFLHWGAVCVPKNPYFPRKTPENRKNFARSSGSLTGVFLSKKVLSGNFVNI